MYFELTAPDKLSFEMAYWDAQVIGQIGRAHV